MSGCGKDKQWDFLAHTSGWAVLRLLKAWGNSAEGPGLWWLRHAVVGLSDLEKSRAEGSHSSVKPVPCNIMLDSLNGGLFLPMGPGLGQTRLC